MEASQRGAVEAEIAVLTQQIEAKRRQLGTDHGIIEGKDLVRHVVAERIGEVMGAAVSAAATDPQTTVPAKAASPKKGSSAFPTYLDSLDDETVAKINNLIQAVFEQGITKTIKTLVEEDPFILDAFHDALTDKLYEELKTRKIIQ